MRFKEASGAMDSKNYVRIKDKESVKGIFSGEPYEFRKHWVSNKSVICSEDNHCSHCLTGLKSSFAFRVNFIINDNGSYVSKIFEQGWTVYESLRNLNLEYPLEQHIVKISRSGSGPTDTTYSILPVPNGIVTNEIKEKINMVKLQDLKHALEPERINSNLGKTEITPPMFNDEELPF